MACKKQPEADRTENGVKVFLRYVEDIVRTVKGDPWVILEVANKLHPNFQFKKNLIVTVFWPFWI